MLDIPTQRTGTEFGVIGLVNDEGLRRVRQNAGNLLICQTVIEL